MFVIFYCKWVGGITKPFRVDHEYVYEANLERRITALRNSGYTILEKRRKRFAV